VSKIEKTFKALKAKKEGALIGYVTAGDPEPKITSIIADALIDGGVDILELGIPFSDPIADGPTIQAASLRALKAGTTPKQVLKIAEEIRKKHDTPIVILTYYNPIFKMGLKNFFSLLKNYKIDGVVVPDLPVEEADDYHRIAKDYGVDTIFLVTPSTSNQRLLKIIKYSSGFLYLVSQFGVTGIREKLQDSTIKLIKKMLPKTSNKIPLAVGFGISKPEHAKLIFQSGSEGVIVGSAFVKIIKENKEKPEIMLNKISEFAHELKNVMKSTE
jgi:tryptophan synthase alpha chain